MTTDGLSSNEFVAEIKKFDARGRILRFRQTSIGSSNTIFINFYNVPETIINGADRENNRVMISVSGFDDKDLDKKVTRVSVSLRISFLPREQGFRARTTNPASAAQFIRNFLDKVARENEPKIMFLSV